MTIEKAVLLRFKDSHERGAPLDQDARDLAETLANKVQRMAFPDAFVHAVEEMRLEIVKRHAKRTPIGVFLDGALEIRVRATPGWQHGADIEFLFIFEKTSEIPPDADVHVDTLLKLFEKSEIYPDARGRAVGLDRITARTYRSTDRLDLQRLSKAD